MIIRDEERCLPDCLASLRGVVDEIVVVDTGSVDASVEIAEAHGARVIHDPWRDDFAAARNVALDNVVGRWVLYIDADERLRPVDRHRLEAMLDDPRHVAYRVLLHLFSRATPSLEYRMWRNDPRIRFRGVMHEKIVYALEEVAATEGQRIGDSDIALDHVGYDGDQMRKHRRNLPLLQAQLSAEPDNVYNWNHLAKVLKAMGRRDEAERALEQAVEVILTAHVPPDHASLAWAELVRFRQEQGDDVADLVREGRARWPENWLLVWLEAQVLQQAGRHDDAIQAFQRLLDADLALLPRGRVSYDERIFGPYAHASIGLSLFRVGRYSDAAEAYAAAERLEPQDAEYRVKRLLAEGRAVRARAAVS